MRFAGIGSSIGLAFRLVACAATPPPAPAAALPAAQAPPALATAPPALATVSVPSPAAPAASLPASPPPARDPMCEGSEIDLTRVLDTHTCRVPLASSVGLTDGDLLRVEVSAQRRAVRRGTQVVWTVRLINTSGVPVSIIVVADGLGLGLGRAPAKDTPGFEITDTLSYPGNFGSDDFDTPDPRLGLEAGSLIGQDLGPPTDGAEISLPAGGAALAEMTWRADGYPRGKKPREEDGMYVREPLAPGKYTLRWEGPELRGAGKRQRTGGSVDVTVSR